MSTRLIESQIAIHEFIMPKSGHSLAECEDSICVNRQALKFAVADGATEAFDSASWSKRLAAAWVALDDDCLDADSFLNWAAGEGAALGATWQGLKLSWFAEEKALVGSFAAFAGMKLSPVSGGWRWSAIAVGDTCLFHLRERSVVSALPLNDPAGFGSAPVLLPSNNPDRALVRSSIVAGQGDAVAGDELLLMSDAISAWFLSLASAEDTWPLEFLRALQQGNERTISTIVESERSQGRLKDDDVSILHIWLR
jgi:hypothetical protein